MEVARFSEKIDSAVVFFELESTILYRLAAVPDALAATLTPDTLLTDPKTGRQTPLKEMSTRELDRALDALEERAVPVRNVPAAGGVTLTGATREEFAADTLRIMGLLSEQITGIRGRKGALAGDSKQRVLAAIENSPSVCGLAQLPQHKPGVLFRIRLSHRLVRKHEEERLSGKR